jgi:hypothetical protein
MEQSKFHLLLWILCAVLIVAATAYLHKDNDGFWYQGDAPRHAMNGVFWGDFAASGKYRAPQQYALAYYNYYPAIAPTHWPPFVYLIEAAVFHIAGVSAAAARGVILFFAVVYGIYLILLVRELGGGELGGWLALLVLVQPGFLVWTNAVMMEIPALALGTACIYHLERAARGGGGHLIAAAFFAVVSALTRQVGVLLPIAYAIGMLAVGRGRHLLTRKALLLAVLAALALAPWVFINLKYEATRMQEATELGAYSFFSLDNWLYYWKTLPENLSWWFIALAVVACVLGLASGDASRRIPQLLIALVVFMGLYTLISVKDARYAIGVLTLGGCLITVGIERVVEKFQWPRPVWAAAIVIIVATCGYSVATIRAPRLDGMRQTVDEILRDYHGERLLYDGFYNGVFTFYVRANPNRGDIKIVRGSKAFYAVAVNKDYGLEEYVRTPEQFISIVSQVGCRWLVFEREEVMGVKAAEIARTVVTRDASFRLVRSFPVMTKDIARVTYLDVYEYVGPLTDTLADKPAFPILASDRRR